MTKVEAADTVAGIRREYSSQLTAIPSSNENPMGFKDINRLQTGRVHQFELTPGRSTPIKTILISKETSTK